MDANELRALKDGFDWLREIPGLALHARTSGGEYHGPCPVCGGSDRFVCWPHHAEGARAWCRQCHPESMDPIAFLQWRDGLSFPEALARLAGRPVPPRPVVRPLTVVPARREQPAVLRPAKPLKRRPYSEPTLVDITDFETPRGELVLRKERYEPGWPDRHGKPRDKSFILYHQVDGAWVKGRPPDPLPWAMFDLRRIVEAPPGSWVFLTEGELKAKALQQAGYYATTTWESGSSWQPHYRAAFTGHHAVILEDNDALSAERTTLMLPGLLEVAASVRVIRFSDTPDGGDLLDWLECGHTLDELMDLVAATPPAGAPAPAPAPAPPATPAAPYPLLTAADLAALPPPSWLIENLFETGKLTGLYGFYGSGKSFLALDWALCVATGRPWQGHATQAGPVVYICPEGVSGLYRRVAAWQQVNGVDTIPDTFRVLPATVNMLDPETPGKLLATLTAYGLADARLLIIDTLARSMPGAEEDNAHFSIVVDHAGQVQRATGAAVLVVHHSGKDSAAGWRGGTAFPAGADTIIGFKNDDGVISLTCEKQRDGEYFPATRWVLVKVPLGQDAAGKEIGSCILGPASLERDPGGALSEKARQVLEALCEPVFEYGATLRELRESTGLGDQTIFRALNLLLRRELVMSTGTKRSTTHRSKATKAGYDALGLVPPWLRQGAAGLPGIDSVLAKIEARTSTTDMPLSPPGSSDTDTPHPPLQARTDNTFTGLSSDFQPLSVTDPGLSDTIPPPKGNSERESVGALSAAPAPLTHDQTPDPNAPRWETPPPEAAPRPLGVCTRGHSQISVAWDAAAERWRCRSCWEIRRE